MVWGDCPTFDWGQQGWDKLLGISWTYMQLYYKCHNFSTNLTFLTKVIIQWPSILLIDLQDEKNYENFYLFQCQSIHLSKLARWLHDH